MRRTRGRSFELAGARRGPGPLGRGRRSRASRERARRLADLLVVLVRAPDGQQLVNRVEVVDVELPVEMIELVLQRASEQAGPGDLDLLAPAVLGHDPDLLPARDVCHIARDRQAPLEVTV